MSEIRISIEQRNEACSESAARLYASAHGIDVNEDNGIQTAAAMVADCMPRRRCLLRACRR
jgi:hypothetical protein